MKLKFSWILYLVLLILLLLVLIPYLKPVNYVFKEGVTIGYPNLKGVYNFKIIMSTKPAFIPNQDIDVNVELSVVDDSFWEIIKDQKDIRLFFLNSFESKKDPNSQKLEPFGGGGMMMFSKKASLLGDRYDEFFVEEDIGQIVLEKTEDKKFSGSGKIVYKSPGHHSYLIAFNRGHVNTDNFQTAVYKIFLNEIPIGSTTDLMIKRTNNLVLWLMIINIILVIYIDILKKRC